MSCCLGLHNANDLRVHVKTIEEYMEADTNPNPLTLLYHHKWMNGTIYCRQGCQTIAKVAWYIQ